MPAGRPSGHTAPSRVLKKQRAVERGGPRQRFHGVEIRHDHGLELRASARSRFGGCRAPSLKSCPQGQLNDDSTPRTAPAATRLLGSDRRLAGAVRQPWRKRRSRGGLGTDAATPGPMMAVKLTRSNATSTPRRASTADGPVPKRLTRLWPRTTAVREGAGAAPGHRLCDEGARAHTHTMSRARTGSSVVVLEFGRGQQRSVAARHG
jgi:hypothetical protein